MNVIGIDPGKSGAIAFLSPDEWRVEDMPLKDGRLDVRELLELIQRIDVMVSGQPLSVVIERVWAMPRKKGDKKIKMGAQSSFNFGETFGATWATVDIYGLPYTFVAPAVWKRRAGLTDREKDYSRTRAIELFGDPDGRLKRKKDHGRAEALLIARFGVSHYAPGADLL